MMKDCPECGGSGEWVNPFNNAASPCSLGCKSVDGKLFKIDDERLDRLTKQGFISHIVFPPTGRKKGCCTDLSTEPCPDPSTKLHGLDELLTVIPTYTGRVIGGPAHGQKVTCGSSRYEVAMMPDWRQSYMFDKPSPLEPHRFTYRREQLILDGVPVRLWVPADWVPDHLCLRIFEELFKRSLKSDGGRDR